MENEHRLEVTQRKRHTLLSRYYEPRMHSFDDEWQDSDAPITRKLLQVL